jgi:hypothetical protein
MDTQKQKKHLFRKIIRVIIMNKNTRKDKITAIIILQQTYCAESVLSIKILNNLSDEDINELYTNWIEYKIKIKKLLRTVKNKI